MGKTGHRWPCKCLSTIQPSLSTIIDLMYIQVHYAMLAFNMLALGMPMYVHTYCLFMVLELKWSRYTIACPSRAHQEARKAVANDARTFEQSVFNDKTNLKNVYHKESYNTLLLTYNVLTRYIIAAIAWYNIYTHTNTQSDYCNLCACMPRDNVYCSLVKKGPWVVHITINAQFGGGPIFQLSMLCIKVVQIVCNSGLSTL